MDRMKEIMPEKGVSAEMMCDRLEWDSGIQWDKDKKKMIFFPR